MCKKKFKNETSKNYHEMFHTQEERDEANGVRKPKSRTEDFSDSDSDSEMLENRKTKKGGPKAKEEVKKVEKEVLKTKPEMVKAEAAKVLKKRFSEASEDSDNACDSNYLSLKHISMSIKKQDERRGAKEVSSSIPKPIEKQPDVTTPPKAALAKTKSQPKLPIESESEEKPKPKAPSQKPEPKSVTKQKPKAVISEPLSSKKVKLTCDQCKKKFSEIMALEYHKITFHAEVAPSPPTPAPIRATISAKSNKPALSKVQKDQRLSNAKTKHVKESDESESESESDEGAAPNTPEPEMKRYADEKNKLSALSGIFNKKRFSSSSSEPIKKGRDALKFKTDKKEAVTKVKPKKVTPKTLKTKIYSDSDSESESESDHKSSKAAKQKAKLKKSEPSKAKVATKPKRPEPELKEDEEEKLSDGEEKEKYKKVPCNMCGRQMANEFVLQYHLVRCPGRKLKYMFVHDVSEGETKAPTHCSVLLGAKKRQSVDSPAAPVGDPERKKAKKDSVETEKAKTSVAVGKNVKQGGGGEDVKKIDNPKWWGGDLKDIYTDRRKKKVDYLEVSDIEESDGDGDDGEEEEGKKIKKKDASAQKKNLNKESRVSSTSDEDSDKEESLQKRKSIEKKPLKKESAVEKKRKTASQPKSIAVQIFKGKRKEDSSEDEESPTKEKSIAVKEGLAKDARKRKSETLPVSEESPLSKSTKKKALPVAKTSREKMVTSDSEPEIVKKDMIKIEDDSEEKSASLAEHDLLSNQIREKLLSNKSEKVRIAIHQ